MIWKEEMVWLNLATTIHHRSVSSTTMVGVSMVYQAKKMELVPIPTLSHAKNSSQMATGDNGAVDLERSVQSSTQKCVTLL